MNPQLPDEALDRIAGLWQSGDGQQMQAAYESLALLSEAAPIYEQKWGREAREKIVGEIAERCGAPRATVNLRLKIADTFPASITSQFPLTFHQWRACRVPDGNGGVDRQRIQDVLKWVTQDYPDSSGGLYPTVEAIFAWRKATWGKEAADAREKLLEAWKRLAERTLRLITDPDDFLRRTAESVLDGLNEKE